MFSPTGGVCSQQKGVVVVVCSPREEVVRVYSATKSVMEVGQWCCPQNGHFLQKETVMIVVVFSHKLNRHSHAYSRPPTKTEDDSREDGGFVSIGIDVAPVQSCNC